MTFGPTASPAAVTVAGADGFAAIMIATVTVIVPGMSPTEPPATHWQGWFRVPGRLLKARTTNLNPEASRWPSRSLQGRSLTVPQTAGGAPCGFGRGVTAPRRHRDGHSFRPGPRGRAFRVCRSHRLG